MLRKKARCHFLILFSSFFSCTTTRSDVILQRLVYKLVPGLLVSEIRRRRDFSIKKGIDYPEAAELASNSIAEEIETPTDLPTVLTLDDVVSLSIEYYRRYVE